MRVHVRARLLARALKHARQVIAQDATSLLPQHELTQAQRALLRQDLVHLALAEQALRMHRGRPSLDQVDAFTSAAERILATRPHAQAERPRDRGVRIREALLAGTSQWSIAAAKGITQQAVAYHARRLRLAS